jgi:hypothetical protein
VQGKTIDQARDGMNLKLTFRRTVDTRLWNQWQEVVQIATGLHFEDEEDIMIWQFTSFGRFSVQYLYAVINDEGSNKFTLLVWRLSVPPRLHIFLWLMANNKTLTRHNLAKRRIVEDKSCLFYADKESIHHLFFNYCVAKFMWQVCSDISGKDCRG